LSACEKSCPDRLCLSTVRDANGRRIPPGGRLGEADMRLEQKRYFVKAGLGAAIALAWAIAGPVPARAADLVGTVASTAGAAVGTVTGALGGGVAGGGAGGAAAPRGGGATSPSLAAFLTGNRDGGNVSGGGSAGGGLNFGGQNGDTSDNGFVLNARAESTLGYNIMVTKKIFTW
jgi:hypothetical protein